MIWLIMLTAYVIATGFSTLLHTATNRYMVQQAQWNGYIGSPMQYIDAGLCAALFITVFVLSIRRPTRKIMRGLIIAVIAFSIYILATFPGGVL